MINLFNMKTARFFIFSGIFLIMNFSLSAQISQGGQPLSFKTDNKNLTKEIPYETMPEINIAALKAEDTKNDYRGGQPWRFGENIEVDLNNKNSGVWDILSDGTKVWRLGIHSRGAVSINLTFKKYRLPQGAELFIYTADKKELIGAFTEYNNRKDGKFATTLLPGDKIILEYMEPAIADFSGDIQLSQVTHGYRGVYEFSKAFGESGYCNVNVACAEGAQRTDEIRSVAMLVTGGNGFCSGALINNTRFDGKPYFLSADHCYSDPASVVYWFNWQSETCENPSSAPSYNSISGAEDVARNSESDFWLVELSTAPDENFDPFYAGWNRTLASELNETVWGIHHPAGDIKKISWASGGVTESAYYAGTGSGETHWRVGSWDDGTTTEGGSSGSPLFDSNGRIIGQLHGGDAACGNTDPDWYGRLGASWSGAGTSSSRLSDWLDPNDSGIEAIDGFGPYDVIYTYDAQISDIVSPEASYSEPVSIVPSVIIKNRGTSTMTTAAVSYTLNGEPGAEINWTGSLEQYETEILFFPEINLTVGNHIFLATIDFANDENTANNALQKDFEVNDCGTGFSIPFTEDFEQGATPNCWNYEGTNWIFQSGGMDGHPSAANTGSFNALFFNDSFTDEVSKLVSPKLKLSGLTQASLEFWHVQSVWEGDQDELSIYYKASQTDNWTLLETYSSDIPEWTERQIALPNLSDDYYIAFEATARWGYGVVIDDIKISDSPVSNESLLATDFSIYPNPTEALLKIHVPRAVSSCKIQIRSITGSLLYESRQSGSDLHTIDISNYASGMYFLNIQADSLSFSEKIIKQ
jgi:V8-like Glu-specific endopeptidase